MQYLPIFLRLQSQRALVVGGGKVAARKAEALCRAGARVTVIAPALGTALCERVHTGDVDHRAERFAPSQLSGVKIVIAASDDAALNADVAHACKARGIPVNVVDTPALCSFIMPALVDRSPLVIAVASGGNAPVLARYWRARIEALVPSTAGRVAELAGRYRQRVQAVLTSGRLRLRFWESAFDGPPARRALAGDMAGAAAALEALLTHHGRVRQPAGVVYLVGAGPGDPDLLTVKALRLMQRCDVVLYDRLVSESVLDLVRRDAERVFVGKRRRSHSVAQEQLNALMVRLAREGKRVLRLKGGDPFVFGRGGEEIEYLAGAGIAFEVVPGITAASGCAAYAGIPLTHRDCAQACVFVTGHRRRDGDLALNWASLARQGQTVVFYMALASLAEICREMSRHGLGDAHPAALVEQGTCPRQRVAAASLSTLPAEAARRNVTGPAILIVGEVVRLRSRLGWFGEEDGTAAETRHATAPALHTHACGQRAHGLEA